jgi:hypothetical protein
LFFSHRPGSDLTESSVQPSALQYFFRDRTTAAKSCQGTVELRTIKRRGTSGGQHSTLRCRAGLQIVSLCVSVCNLSLRLTSLLYSPYPASQASRPGIFPKPACIPLQAGCFISLRTVNTLQCDLGLPFPAYSSIHVGCLRVSEGGWSGSADGYSPQR